MRVLLISSGSGSRGGGEIFLRYLSEGLAARGHKVLLWLPDHDRMDELANQCADFATIVRRKYANTYDHRWRCLSTMFNRVESQRLAREWADLKPDILHLNKQNLEDGLDLLRALNVCSVPSICTVHLTQSARYLRARFGWLRDVISRHALSRHKGALVTVQETRRLALSKFLNARVPTTTIFNGVAIPQGQLDSEMRRRYRRELGVGDDELLVLGVGRLVPQKRPMAFLDAVDGLRASLPNAKFLWVGDGELRPDWEREIKSRALGDIVSATGWRADVQPFLGAADLLLHVADFEGLPFAIIEAMAAGLPCAVPLSLAKEVPFFDPSNVIISDDLKRIAAVLADPAELSRIAATGQRLVKDALSLGNMVAAYERLYEDGITARGLRSLRCEEAS